MAKMIVNSPSGEQQVIEVGIGGEYFDQSLVVWDERKDGKISENIEIEAGKMVRVGNDISKSLDVLPDHKTWLDSKPREHQQIEIKTLQQLVSTLKDKGIL